MFPTLIIRSTEAKYLVHQSIDSSSSSPSPSARLSFKSFWLMSFFAGDVGVYVPCGGYCQNRCNVDQRVTHIIKRYDRLLGELDEGALLLGNGGESAVRPINAHWTLTTLTNHSIWWMLHKFDQNLSKYHILCCTILIICLAFKAFRMSKVVQLGLSAKKSKSHNSPTPCWSVQTNSPN